MLKLPTSIIAMHLCRIKKKVKNVCRQRIGGNIMHNIAN